MAPRSSDAPAAAIQAGSDGHHSETNPSGSGCGKLSTQPIHRRGKHGIGRPRLEAKRIARDGDAQRLATFARDAKTLDRQRVQRLHSRLRRRASAPRGGASSHSTRAARAGEPASSACCRARKRRADFDDPITPGRCAKALERRQQIDRHASAAGAELDHIAAVRAAEDLRALAREAIREKRRQFRRRDEIPVGTEAHAPGRVITEIRFVEHDLHELRKRYPAAGLR